MKLIKTYENFNQKKVNNITIQDIRDIIRKGGCFYTKTDTNPIKPRSVDDNGLITVEIEDEIREIEIDNVDSIEF